ncbi:hypothetical protein N9Z27_01485 [Alphaproteobacteria bacterium]|nr:hypothetical protein [Alphaproteobacteria bacterium]
MSKKDGQHYKIQLGFTVFSVLLIAGISAVVSQFHHFQSAYAAAFSGQAVYDSRYDRQEVVDRLRQDSSALMSLSPHHIVQIFHDPELVRTEGAMTMFQYRTDSCVLDLYFKSSGAGAQKASIVYYEARPRGHGAGPSSSDLAPCVHDLMRKIHKPRMVDVSAIFKSP